MFYKKIIIVWALFNTCLAHTQTVDEIFRNFNKQYSSSKPLQYKSSYTLYKDFDAAKAEHIYHYSFWWLIPNPFFQERWWLFAEYPAPANLLVFFFSIVFFLLYVWICFFSARHFFRTNYWFWLYRF